MRAKGLNNNLKYLVCGFILINTGAVSILYRVKNTGIKPNTSEGATVKAGTLYTLQ